jgi:hypothetical protein
MSGGDLRSKSARSDAENSPLERFLFMPKEVAYAVDVEAGLGHVLGLSMSRIVVESRDRLYVVSRRVHEGGRFVYIKLVLPQYALFQ